jgi:hypothetical protein
MFLFLSIFLNLAIFPIGLLIINNENMID